MVNAAKIVEKEPAAMTIVINRAGAAGISIAKLLVRMGFGDILMCDSRGIIYDGASWLNPFKKEIAASMVKKAVVFPMANPVPEIMPKLAL